MKIMRKRDEQRSGREGGRERKEKKRKSRVFKYPNVTHAKYEGHTEKQRRHNVVGKIKLGAPGWLSS